MKAKSETPPKKPFIYLSSPSLNFLETEVNAAMREGYAPFGSVVMLPANVFVQAVILMEPME